MSGGAEGEDIMKHTFTTKTLSLLLTLVMLLGMLPAAALAAEEGPSDAAISALTELYSGDENRARSDLEAMYASGLIDESGSMVALDIREGGESVELAALTQRIAAGEDVGAITVNGNAATTEQIMQISQVSAALEIAQLLDEEIDVTDEHVANLESLLTGLADGSADLDSALRSGELSLSKGNGTATLMGDGDNSLNLSDDGKSYIANYISGSTYEPIHAFVECHEDMLAIADPFCCPDPFKLLLMKFFNIAFHIFRPFINICKGIQRTSQTITVSIKRYCCAASDKNRIACVFNFFCKRSCTLIKFSILLIDLP